MSTILVTGGAGFIGSHTVVELVQAGYRPVIVDNFSTSEQRILDKLQQLLGQIVTCYKQDYQDTAGLQQIIDDEQVEGIIHFAAFKSVSESVAQPLKYYANNLPGFIDLLELLQSRPAVTKLVFSSSCTVYGEAEELPVTEATPLRPAVSPYGSSKQMAETVLRDATGVSPQLRSLSLRYFNPIGAHPSALIGELPVGVPNNLVPFVTQTAAGLRDKLTVYGNDYPTPDGSCIRDYIHVVDVAKAHVKALSYLDDKPASFYDVINLGLGQGASVLEIIKLFEEVTGQKVPYEIGPRRPGDVAQTYAAVDKAHEVLGWTAEKSLADALSDAWRWQQSLGQAAASEAENQS